MSLPIAIVGLGCVVPGARDVPSFLENLRGGRQSLVPVPPTAWDHRLHYSGDRSEPDRAYASLGGFVTDFVFDWRRFRVPPADAATVNPMQWMVLEAGAQALGGIANIPRDSTAIILGSTGLGWQPDSGFRIRLDEMLDAVRESEAFRGLPRELQVELLERTSRSLQERLKEVSEDNVVGASASVAAGRINMHFDLKGPHYSVDAGFASSLAALDLAVRGLRDGEFDLAVTGGVSERLSPLELIAFSKLGGLSPTELRPFDARADGTLLGEGAVLFALKRLEDAERDKDAIHAVLLGVGGSSDGRGKSLVAPNPVGQALAMRRALADAGGLAPASVGYVECHATGTPVGDASELTALGQVYGAGAPGSIALGSVKANVGHLRAAAGAAGMLRATLALQHGELFPQSAFEQPNPRLELERTPFWVPRERRPLGAPAGAPLRAAVSAFSFGGNNFHAILEAFRPGGAPVSPRRPAPVAPEPLALIGLGGMFPGADDVEGLWRLLEAGGDRTQAVPADRYDIERYLDPSRARKDKSYTRLGAFLDRLPAPDATMRIPPAAWASLDPSHVVSLASAAEALRDAGFAPGKWDHDRVGLSLAFLPYQGKKFLADLRIHWREFAAALEQTLESKGVAAAVRTPLLREAEERLKRGLPPITEDTLTGYIGSLNAGRIASLYDFHGPHFVVDSACASGLAAIHAASKMLHHGVADVVLAGGVWCDMMPEFFIAACRFNALSANGSFPFDARADGFIPGEGGGIAVLKRLSDAERDGDRIRAVIRGVAGSSDGRGRSVLAPSREGEGLAMRRALAISGVSAASVEYVECHGTGTALGDVTEAGAVSDVYANGVVRERPIAIGSVKSNIGHLNAAAGVAGLFKAALAVERGVIPASIKLETRNPKLPADVEVVSERRIWATGVQGGPRRAGVSTFGVGGANFHLVVEEHRARPPAATSTGGPSPALGTPVVGPSRVVAAAGTDPRACVAALERLASRWAVGEVPALADRGAPGAVRVAVTAVSAEELSRKLKLLSSALERGGPTDFLLQSGVFLAEADSPLNGAPVALTFPGQGGQYANMLSELGRVYPEVRDTLAEADGVYVGLTGRRLSDAFAFEGAPADWVQRDEDMHAAVLAVNVALSRLIRSFGITPAAFLGQSAGELAALVESQVLSLADGLRAMHARTLAVLELQTADPGSMAALACGAEQVPALLEGLPGVATLAADNGPRACIVSADGVAMPHLVRRCEAQGLECTRLAVSHGYHSMLIGGARAPYERVLQGLAFARPRTEIVSTIDAMPYGARPAAALPAFLASQFVEPVRLREAYRRAHAMGIRVFLEAGPRWSLTQFARESLHGLAHGASASIHPKVGEVEQFQRLLAFCFVHRLGSLEPVAASSPTGFDMPPQSAQNDPVQEPTVQDAEEALLGLPLLELLGADAARNVALALGRRFGVDASQVPASQLGTLSDVVARIEALSEGPPAVAQKDETVMASSTSVTAEELRRVLMEDIVAKTGYPEEMLEEDFDLEADLGIDTVKQVDIYATVRARFGIERDPNVPLRSLNTVRKALAHFRERLDASPAARAPAAVSPAAGRPPAPPPGVAAAPLPSLPVAPVVPAPVPAPAQAPARASSGAADVERVAKVLIQNTVEKTGYPEEMLELDLDLEADLGIDTVKQVDIFARTRAVFAVERDPNVPLRDLNTLRKVARHIAERMGGTASAASAEVAAAQAPGGVLGAQTAAEALLLAAAAPSADPGGVRATLLAMGFDELGIGHEAVHRLTAALAGRLGVPAPVGGPPPRSFGELLALVAGRGTGTR